MDGATRIAANAIPVFETVPGAATYFPKGYQQLTLSGGANPSPLTVPARAVFAVIGVSGDIVRYRDDGVAPDATHGIQIMPNTALPYSGPLAAIQFFSVNGTGILDILYYGNS
jgi:hypothetical protein